MSTEMSFCAEAPAAVPAGVAAVDPVNDERHRPYSLQKILLFTEPGQPTGNDWSLSTLGSFNAVLQAGVRQPRSVAGGRMTTRRAAQVPGRFVLWGFAAFSAAIASMRRRWLERCIVATLQRLDDAILKDIGICRSEIPYVARTKTSGKWRS